MTAELETVQPVLMCSDMTRSIRFYEKLGFAVTFRDSPSDPKYVAIQRDGVELHLQWHAKQDFAQGDRPTYRFRLQDVDGLYAEFGKSGAVSPAASGEGPWTRPSDTPWKTREFHVRDPDGNGLQFYHPF